jgi:prepilin-type N-terminal cleavage/methylation domain-containing protein
MLSRPFSFTALRRRLDAIQAEGLNDSGFTMIELVISMSILVIVSTMAIAVLISIQRTTQLVSWQSNANTELRQFVDSSFAELATARPRTLCVGADGTVQSTMPRNCAKPLEGLGSALESAGTHHVCYLSHRADPVSNTAAIPVEGEAAAAQVTGYARVCLAIINKKLWKVVWLAPSAPGTDLNTLVPTTAKYTALGDVDDAASTFRFYGKVLVDGSGAVVPAGTAGAREKTKEIFAAGCSADSSNRLVCAAPASSATTDIALNPSAYVSGTTPTTFLTDNLVAKTVASGKISGAIVNITRMQVVVSVITKDRRHTRALEYDVSLRGSKYQNERCFSDELSLDPATGVLKCV